MERGDEQLQLYADLAAHLKQAHARVRALDVPDGVAVALTRKLLVITASAKHDVADASRRLARLMDELETGEPREPGTP